MMDVVVTEQIKAQPRN